MVWSEAAGVDRQVLARVIPALLAATLLTVALAACGGADGETRRGAPPLGDGGGASETDASPDDGAGEGGGTDGDDGGRAGSGSAGTGSGAGSGSGSGGDTAGSGEPPPPLDTPSDCVEPAINQPPEELRCTGLYADIAAKDVAAGLEPFVPAHQLWSDGAEKERWIYLPPGTQIDSSDPDDWRFPVGTKLFKEFSWNGRRVETRMFWKTNPTLWIKAAYRWNDDESEATRFGGGDIDVDGDTYHIPSGTECDQCHKGRVDRSLGFELVALALPGATGMTLERLVADELLSDPPSQTAFEIGDQGAATADALGYLHINCGVSCHNDNTTAEAYKTDMYLRLPADGLDGRSPADFDLITTTVGVDARTPRWSDKKRIVAGSPEDSLLYQLIAMRNPENPKDQMPPIASRIVHEQGVKLVGDWIRGL